MTTPLQTFDPRTARTWAEVDLDRIAANARALRRRFAGPESAGGEVMAVVKADAYGHGAARVAPAAQAAGISRFGVASVAEAQELRRVGVGGDVYLLSPLLPQEAEAAVRADLIPMVSSPEQMDALIAAGRGAPLPARCFLKVDTGMGRSGAPPEQAVELWRRGREPDGLRVVGLATHFSSADEMDDAGRAVTRAQADAFYAFVSRLWEDSADERGGDNGHDGRGNAGIWLSMENSPGALLTRDLRRQPLPGVRGHLTRAGLLLYGIEPYPGALSAWDDVAPALTWRARLSLLRDLPAGATVGYGRTHTLGRDSRIATVAAGYADGVPRRLSNAGSVLLRGRRYPIVGRVSMDQFQIDVTDAPPSAPAALGDAVTILGTDGTESQTALDIATRIETTPHEPTCALTARVPRLYVRRG